MTQLKKDQLSVLVIGGGGREHALVWKIAQSPRVAKLYAAPGNVGIADIAQTLPISAENIDEILAFVEERDIDLVVVGPEAPLAAGLSDLLIKAGRAVFGPTQAAAAIESSKQVAKDLMQKYGIPTAKYAVFENMEQAIAYIKEVGAPVVVKADGLAAGKGVVVAMNQEEAVVAVRQMMEEDAFGKAGSKIVIEEYLEGEEVSILAFCDGEHIVPMVSAQDHKRAYDNDQGPNTGGMGAYSPAPVYTPQLAQLAEETILKPTVAALKAEGRLYQGVLYIGLMITATGPKVLEYNARFGDPETQPVLMRLKTDLIDIIEATINQTLDRSEIEWEENPAVCVVIAAGGYPGSYAKGNPISGIMKAESLGAKVFHAGTTQKDGEIVSNGGRVLGVTAMADTLEHAVSKVYRSVEQISFKECFYRHDIGYRAIQKK